MCVFSKNTLYVTCDGNMACLNGVILSRTNWSLREALLTLEGAVKRVFPSFVRCEDLIVVKTEEYNGSLNS